MYKVHASDECQIHVRILELQIEIEEFLFSSLGSLVASISK